MFTISKTNLFRVNWPSSSADVS